MNVFPNVKIDVYKYFDIYERAIFIHKIKYFNDETICFQC